MTPAFDLGCVGHPMPAPLLPLKCSRLPSVGRCCCNLGCKPGTVGLSHQGWRIPGVSEVLSIPPPPWHLVLPAARRPGKAESGGLPSGWQSQGCWQGARTRASLPPVAVGRATGGPAERVAKKQTPAACVSCSRAFFTPLLPAGGLRPAGKVPFWPPAPASAPCPAGSTGGGLSLPFLPLGSRAHALDSGLEWV